MAKNTINEAEAINIIAAGTSIKGDLKTDGVIRLNGTLIGNLETSEKLVIGQMGKVEGDIKCKNADVEGHITGTISVTELLCQKMSKPQKSNKLDAYAKYSSIAIQMAVIITVGTVGGVKLDEFFEFEFPLLTLILSLFSVILAMYMAIKDVIKYNK
jgi:cytoskeletal protein CcmA (bactofilin family)